MIESNKLFNKLTLNSNIILDRDYCLRKVQKIDCEEGVYFSLTRHEIIKEIVPIFECTQCSLPNSQLKTLKDPNSTKLENNEDNEEEENDIISQCVPINEIENCEEYLQNIDFKNTNFQCLKCFQEYYLNDDYTECIERVNFDINCI